MKKWFLIDDCGTELFNESMNATTKEEAAEELADAWDALTRADQKRRVDFYAILAEPDEDGDPNFDTSADVVRLG